MPKYRLKVTNPFGGLNTTRNPVGMNPGWFETFKNVRVGDKTFSRRRGMKRVQGSGSCTRWGLDLATASEAQYVQIPVNTSVHQLPPRFTIDIAIRPDEIGSGQARILSFASGDQPFRLVWTADNQVAFSLTDLNGNEYTLSSSYAFDVTTEGAVIPVRIVRDGTDLSMIISIDSAGTVQDSLTNLPANVGCIAPTDDLIIGSTNGTDDTADFSGIVDDFRIFHSALPGHQHAFTSWPDPRYPSLVAYYRFNPVDGSAGDSDGVTDAIVLDDSLFGNHGLVVGSPSFVEGLVVDMEPVVGIINYTPTGSPKQIIWGAGEYMNYSDIH